MPSRSPLLRSSLILALLALGAALAAGSAGAAEEPTRGLRYPALSPDKKLVAFAYRGDIWVAATDGASPARRLTIHEAQDTLPRISPDGRTIAFSSQRNGAYDIYLVPVAGGEVRQLTYHSGGEIVCDWSPDGKRILFVSARDPSPYGLNVYEMSVKGGPPRRITMDGGRDASYSADGKRIVYARGFNSIYQDNYEGSAGYDLYTVPVAGGVPKRLTTSPGNERYPFFSKDGKSIWFVAEEKGVANFYAIPVEGGTRRQLTKYPKLDVHRPDLAWDGQTVVFERWGQLFHTDLTSKERKAIPLNLLVKGDVRHSGVAQRSVTSGAEQVHLSQDAAAMVFSLHGDIWSTSGSGGNARQLTSGKANDEWPRFSPDGRFVAFQSDRAGGSPDGKTYKLQKDPDAGDIFLYELKTGVVTQVTKHPKGDFFHSWSPDGKKLVFCSERSGNRDIWSIDVEDGTTVQLTKDKAADDDPVYSPDGRYIAFDSGRDGQQAIFVMDAEGGNVRRVTNGRGFKQVPSWSPDGSMLSYEILDPASGRSGGVYVIAAAGGPAMQISRNGQTSCWSPRGDYIYFSVGDRGRQEIYRVPAPENVENREKVPFMGTVEVDLRAELGELFDEAWSKLRDGFYDVKMHGVAWDEMKTKYRAMAVNAEDKVEFQNVVSQMLAELNASHLGIAGGRKSSNSVSIPSVPTGYLGVDLAQPTGAGGGRKIVSVFPGGPADQAGLRVGDEIIAIQGRTVKGDTDVDRLLADTVDKEIRVRFRPITEEGQGSPREEKVTPISWSKLRSMQYARWVKRNSDIVRKAGKRRLGYIHLRAMDQGNLASFQRAVANWNRSKRVKGMVLDVRNNGGGNIHQQLMQILTARPFLHVQVRGSPAKVTQPALYWDKPVVLLINERSFSDAEVFPYIFKEIGVGKVVGVPTAGGVIGTNNITLSDGTSFRIPRVAYYGMDGTNLEGLGVEPDIFVEETPEDRVKGRDPQLEKAIEVALAQIRAQGRPARRAPEPTPKPAEKPFTPATPTPPRPPQRPDTGARTAGALDPLMDARPGEWVRYTAMLPGSGQESVLLVRLVELKDGTASFEREVVSGPPVPIPLPTEAPQAPLLEGLASMGRVVDQETITADVKGERVEVAVITMEAFGSQLRMSFTNAVPCLGLLKVQIGKLVVLEASEWGVEESAPEAEKPAPEPEKPAAEAPERPTAAAAPEAAGAPPSPLYDAKVGEWIRLRSIVQGEETVATLRVIEVSDDEVQLESRVAYGGTEIRGAVLRRERRAHMILAGHGSTAEVGRETLEVKGRRLDCITITRKTRRGRVEKRWICLEIPVNGLVRQERDGSVVKELLDWGTGEPPALPSGASR